MKRDYSEVLQHVRGILSGESDTIANLANTAAILKSLPGFYWVGFYRVEGEELVLGPFQGPPACTRLRFGKGVCGTAWKERKTITVPDVDRYPGHVACDALSRSEIVVPVFDDNRNVVWILDVDSDRRDEFDQNDARALERIAGLLFQNEKALP